MDAFDSFSAQDLRRLVTPNSGGAIKHTSGDGVSYTSSSLPMKRKSRIQRRGAPSGKKTGHEADGDHSH